jgi:hypothetical protein
MGNIRDPAKFCLGLEHAGREHGSAPTPVGAKVGKGGWGCAPPDAQQWWVNEAQPCQQPGYSCCLASDYTNKTPPFPGC